MSDQPGVENELQTILEGIGEAFYAVDKDWRIYRFNAGAAQHFRKPAGEMLGRVLWEIFPSARDTDLGRTFLDVFARRATVRGEAMTVVLADPRWLAYRLFPLGGGMGIVFRDVTDLKSAEAHRDLLINELNHRVKNTLAMVQSVAAQTFRGVDTAARGDFEQRLLTLSTVHSLLTDENWDSAELHDVIRASLRLHLAVEAPRISFDGPDMRLKPKSAVAISMALHELGTNALKYGALSNDTGRIALCWTTDEGRFRLRWEERGGPAVAPPVRSGFGSRMIERGLSAELQGGVAIDFRPAGVVCTIDAPLDTMREAG